MEQKLKTTRICVGFYRAVPLTSTGGMGGVLFRKAYDTCKQRRIRVCRSLASQILHLTY
jgi:hypothetical protein